MTVKEALAELEDRDLHEVIELIRHMKLEIELLSDEVTILKAKQNEIEYGGF